MLKHTISGSGGLGRQQQQHVISGDPRGNTSSLFHNDHHPPPTIPRTLPGPYNNRPLPPSMNHSFPGTVHHNRSFNNGNPYSNTSTLSNSKHSNGGTSISISPLGGLSNGGLHLSRLPPPPTSTNYAEALTPRLGVTTGPYVNQLNASTLSTSKHSLGGGSSSVSPLGPPRIANGGFNLSSTGGGGGRPPSRRGPPPANSIVVSPSSSSYIDGRPPTTTPVSVVAGGSGRHDSNGVREMLTSLGLLCLVSLLLALLSLVFMLKISPVTAADVKDFLRSDQVTVISPDEYVLVYEVTLALCALSLSLNLCCLLVCAVQFLFAVKLVRDSPDGERTNEYLKKSAFTRVCAVGGFFVSIPVFLTGIILYTFIQFHSTPAVITSALIGLGIIFCGCAMVHNVFVWQKEKTNAVRTLAQQQRLALHEQSLVDQSSRSLSHQTFIRHSSMNNGSVSPGPMHIPQTSLDNSATPTPPEICTLV